MAVYSEVEWLYPYGLGRRTVITKHWCLLTAKWFEFALFCPFGPRPIGTPLSFRLIEARIDAAIDGSGD